MGKYYAVAQGRKPGIYESWAEAEAQVKGFTKAKFKSFKTKSEAKKFLDDNNVSHNNTYSGNKIGAGRNLHEKTGVSVSILPQTPQIRVSHESSSLDLKRMKLMILVSFDGGSRGNPGLAGAGTEVIVREMIQNVQMSSKKIHARIFVGYKATNNVAEYTGLVCGLRHAFISVKKAQMEHRRRLCRPDVAVLCQHDVDLVVQGDSNLIIRQMNGSYHCRNKGLIPFYKDAKNILIEIGNLMSNNNNNNNNNNSLQTKFEHVYRCRNSVADGLANEAMDAKKTWMTCSEDREDDDRLNMAIQRMRIN